MRFLILIAIILSYRCTAFCVVVGTATNVDCAAPMEKDTFKMPDNFAYWPWPNKLDGYVFAGFKVGMTVNQYETHCQRLIELNAITRKGNRLILRDTLRSYNDSIYTATCVAIPTFKDGLLSEMRVNIFSTTEPYNYSNLANQYDLIFYQVYGAFRTDNPLLPIKKWTKDDNQIILDQSKKISGHLLVVMGSKINHEDDKLVLKTIEAAFASDTFKTKNNFTQWPWPNKLNGYAFAGFKLGMSKEQYLNHCEHLTQLAEIADYDNAGNFIYLDTLQTVMLGVIAINYAINPVFKDGKLAKLNLTEQGNHPGKNYITAYIDFLLLMKKAYGKNVGDDNNQTYTWTNGKNTLVVKYQEPTMSHFYISFGQL